MYVPNLIKSILPNRLVRNLPQRSTPISPTQPPTNPSTVYRERVVQISGNSDFSLGTNLPEEVANDEELKTWIQLLGRQEQTTFLKRVCSSGLILKSFARKSVPTNITFLWQQETLRSQISEVNKMQVRLDYEWHKLPPEKRAFLRKWKSRKKEKLVKKFNKFKKHHQTWQKTKSPKGSISKKRIDRKRYKTSKNKKIIEVAKSKILNYSKFELSDTHYLILGRGFNFVPTPSPSRLKTKEWNNSMQHIRRQEWLAVFSDSERREFEKLPDKLKLDKTNRPSEPNYHVPDKAKVYTDTVLNGMRTFDEWAVLKKQNLQRQELSELRRLQNATGTSIMLCKSDKDSKLIVVDMEDYKSKVQKEISKNFVPATMPDQAKSDEIKEKCRELCKTIHTYDRMSDECLKGAVGVKFNKQFQTYTPVRYYADQFYFNFSKDHAIVYPLWKTHKAASFPNSDSIPIRLVTAANRIPTTKVMAMLEYILAEPMKKYCSTEYTKDSSDFIKSLTENRIYSVGGLSIICFDVEALYPNADREIVILGIRECLALDGWNVNAINAYSGLVQLCMKEIYINFDGNTYTADSGIVTGAPNSVSLANCMLRYVTRRLSTDTPTEIWKRYIDDIICFIRTRDHQLIGEFISSVKAHFREYGLNLTVRVLNPENTENESTIEFLDVNHSFDENDHVQTSLYVKPTAKSATYLHPSSYHPSFIPTGILKSELIRIRKISSNERVFQEGVTEIRNKATRSEFPGKVINAAMEMIKEWDDDKRASLFVEATTKAANNSVVWVSQLPSCIRKKFSTIKKYLPKEVSLRIAYQKPESLQTLLFNPRALEADKSGVSEPCGKCKLCGNHGGTGSMVHITTNLKLKIENKNRNNAFKSKLNCSDAGISRECPRVAIYSAKAVYWT